jgi:hypothetical protein
MLCCQNFSDPLPITVVSRTMQAGCRQDVQGGKQARVFLVEACARRTLLRSTRYFVHFCALCRPLCPCIWLARRSCNEDLRYTACASSGYACDQPRLVRNIRFRHSQVADRELVDAEGGCWREIGNPVTYSQCEMMMYRTRFEPDQVLSLARPT